MPQTREHWRSSSCRHRAAIVVLTKWTWQSAMDRAGQAGRALPARRDAIRPGTVLEFSAVTGAGQPSCWRSWMPARRVRIAPESRRACRSIACSRSRASARCHGHAVRGRVRTGDALEVCRRGSPRACAACRCTTDGRQAMPGSARRRWRAPRHDLEGVPRSHAAAPQRAVTTVPKPRP